MKSIIVFFEYNSSEYADKKVFNGKSAKDLSAEWAKSIGSEMFTLHSECVSDLLTQMKQLCSENKADYVIYSYNDLPFLNLELTKEMINSHVEYKNEYTFADGYPYGFSPELIDAGTLGILAELSKTTQEALGKLPVKRESIFDLIKTDINSFEVESEIAPTDWRLYRFAFHCEKKDNFLQCTALFDALKNNSEVASADEISKVASNTIGCLKTVPGFYNIQIADRVNSNYIYLPYNAAYEEKNKLSPLSAVAKMDYEKFSLLVDNIASFSENAVLSLSAWGEPLVNPDCLRIIEKILSYEGLSVFIETDGLLVTEDFCQNLKKIVENASERTNGWQKVMIAVSLDACTAQKYIELHDGTSEDDFTKAVKAISMLENSVPGCIYPQFVRMNENENELEGFFRYWNEKTNPTGGNFIIQKYEDFAGLLKQRKPADLSPLERNPCWHLRRDMNILSNGDVTQCRTTVLSGVIGNVFTETIENVWHKTDDLLIEHMKCEYKNKCEKCDESYTFNF